MPGPPHIYATDESQPGGSNQSPRSGIRAGLCPGGAVSAVAAILVFIFSMVFLQLQVVVVS